MLSAFSNQQLFKTYSVINISFSPKIKHQNSDEAPQGPQGNILITFNLFFPSVC